MKCLRKLELDIPWWPREDSLVDNLNVSYRLCLHYADRNLSNMDDALSSPYDGVSIDLVTESVGTTNLQAFFLPLVNEAGGQQIVTCIVLSLFLNDMVKIFYPQIYHSSTVFSKLNQLANETHAGNQFAFNYFYCSFTF